MSINVRGRNYTNRQMSERLRTLTENICSEFHVTLKKYYIHMKLLYWLCFFIFLGCVLQSCEGEKASPVYNVPVNVNYEIDGQQVKADTMLYDHPAGYRYSLSKLEYYLSNFALLNDKDEIWESSEIYYLNLERSNTNLLMLQGVSIGS